MSSNIENVNWKFRKRAFKTAIALPVPLFLGWWISYIYGLPPESEYFNHHVVGVVFATVFWMGVLLWLDYRTEVNRAKVIGSVKAELDNANRKQKILDKIPQVRNKELANLLSLKSGIGARYYIDNFFVNSAGLEQILKGLVSYLSTLPEAKKNKENPCFRASFAPRINDKSCEVMYHAASNSINSPALTTVFTKNKKRTDTTLAGYCLETGRTEVISNVESYMSKAGQKENEKHQNKYGFRYLKEKDKILIKSIMCHPITDTDGKNGEEFCGVLSIDTDVPGFFIEHSNKSEEYYWIETIESFLVRIQFYTRLSNISKSIDYNDIA